jgi:phosphatidylglycerophosphate synthase
MTANHITLLGLLSALLLAIVLSLASVSRWMYVAGAALMLLQWSADNLDGVIARSRKQTSLLGSYLDHFGDCLTVALVGISAFVAGGSHVAIGLACTVVYLLALLQVHIKASALDTLELPAFGPTECSFLVAAALLGQAVFDYGRALSWFPWLTGPEGTVTRLLGFSNGLTFLDVCGLLAVPVAALGVGLETWHSLAQIRKADRIRGGRDDRATG